MENVQSLSGNTGMFKSPAKVGIVKPNITYGNSWYTSPLKEPKLFSYPVMCSACMNVVGSGCLYCIYVIDS